MKKLFIILFLLQILQGKTVNVACYQPGSQASGDRVYPSVPDTVTKRKMFRVPFIPRPATVPVTKKPAPPIGTLKISTEIPSTLFYDGDTAATMTVHHQVTVYKVPVGFHTLTFLNDSLDFEQTIRRDTGTTCFYRLLGDTTLMDSIVLRKLELGKKKTIVARYIPFRHALSFEFLQGLTFNGNGLGNSTRFVAGVTINRILRIGIGTGYNLFSSTLIEREYEGFIIPTKIYRYKSEKFSYSFIPVYLNTNLNFMFNRNVFLLSSMVGSRLDIIRILSKPMASIMIIPR